MTEHPPPGGPRPPKRRHFQQGGRIARSQKKQQKNRGNFAGGFQGSNEEVLHHEVRELVRESQRDISASSDRRDPFSEVDVFIVKISSTGDGLGYLEGSSQVYVVPFAVAGDVVRAKIIRHSYDLPYSVTDFLKVIKPSVDRNDSLVKCPYFASCSGCQFQMLPYNVQLEQKKKTVEKAYHNFSGLAPSSIPSVAATIGSPLEYGYRTKLTPHFDGPPGSRRAGKMGETPKFDQVPPIGFMRKGTRHTLDIEVCPIGTEAVQMGLKRERDRVAREIDEYKRGATLLLRESTTRLEPDHPKSAADEGDDTVSEDLGGGVTLEKRCVTVPSQTTMEFVDDFVFQNPASAFFQNNNSILPKFTQYIRDHILGSATLPDVDKQKNPRKLTSLIDAYSGSGLFTITLSSLFKRSIGIDVASQSIDFARINSRLNGLSTSPRSASPSLEYASGSGAGLEHEDKGVSFIAADAGDLFASVPSYFDPEETAVVIDPPRKGCEIKFLHQLVKFGPERIVYVSCNVHTQARDVGWIINRPKEEASTQEGVDGETKAEAGPRYVLESLQGFDFFPQTSHVESVAVLQRVPP
ncbi:MAG: tRNA(m5U54)methyltransferase [Chrysothrix sp. TS-e1954]|nr:MAG: tRNA(m5U54)methyltransferase [Chrysothrix sp. TS-e1954]